MKAAAGLLCLLVAVGCGSDDSPGDGTGGSGGSSGGGTCGTGEGTPNGSGCNTLQPAGQCVTATRVAETAPAPTGGALSAGTYNLTAWTTFTGPVGASGQVGEFGRGMLVVSGSGNNWTSQYAGASGTKVDRNSATMTVAGSTLNLQYTCGASPGAPTTVGYSASGSRLILYFPDQGGTTAQTWTKQ